MGHVIDFAAFRDHGRTSLPNGDRFSELWGALEWQPIAAYNRFAGDDVLLRGERHLCFGSFRRATVFSDSDAENARACWRSTEDSSFEQPLDFEPVEFAVPPQELAIGFAFS